MYNKILEAAARLNGVAHKTPVMTSRLLNEKIGASTFLKCENFQRMGAFKFRGAYNAISALPESARQKGVVTFSSGNHGMAVALTSQIMGIPAVVIVPNDAPEVKIAAIRGYGATIVTYDRFKEDREIIAKEYMQEKGLTLIPPFDNEYVLAGQGTLAKELFEEVGELDYLFVQVGGGGLISGCAIAANHLAPNCKVIAVEPEVSNDTYQSFQSGVRTKHPAPDSVADGLNTPIPGIITFPLIQKYVHDVITVSEQEILETMYYLWTRTKIMAEPSGAVAIAAAFHGKIPVHSKRIGAVISGGNVDVRLVSKFFAGM